MFANSYLLGLLVLSTSLSLSLSLQAQTPSVPAVEIDQRLHADGKGWKYNKAVINDKTRPCVLLIEDSIRGDRFAAVKSACRSFEVRP